jgi:hypothetical protein
MPENNTRRFPPPWSVEQIPGGYVIKDANGQSLAYVYGRESRADADPAHVLTMDEARRIASNIAKQSLPKPTQLSSGGGASLHHSPVAACQRLHLWHSVSRSPRWST